MTGQTIRERCRVGGSASQRASWGDYKAAIDAGRPVLVTFCYDPSAAGGLASAKRRVSNCFSVLGVGYMKHGDQKLLICHDGITSAEAAEGESVRIEMQPTGVLVIKPEPGLLAGIDNPSVVYRISDADGQVVFPGGEGQGRGVWDTGAAALGGERPEGFRVDVLPVGSYTIKWELHRGSTVEEPSPRGLEPLASGEAQLQITKGEETLLVLSK